MIFLTDNSETIMIITINKAWIFSEKNPIGFSNEKIENPNILVIISITTKTLMIVIAISTMSINLNKNIFIWFYLRELVCPTSNDEYNDFHVISQDQNTSDIPHLPPPLSLFSYCI